MLPERQEPEARPIDSLRASCQQVAPSGGRKTPEMLSKAGSHVAALQSAADVHRPAQLTDSLLLLLGATQR